MEIEIEIDLHKTIETTVHVGDVIIQISNQNRNVQGIRMATKTIKIPFHNWKTEARKLDLQNSHISFDGTNETVSIKPIKNKKK